MGDTGPCGPSSEIFYDHGPSIPGGPPGSPDQDGDRFVEIWNLVFMQFEEGPPGTRIALPRPSIDTGMGLERLAAILQGKHDNYDTDTLRALILASAEATGQDPGRPVPRQPSRGRRPSAQRRVPDRRWRAAVERGPRLRAAPDHAPRDAACAHDGRARAADAPAGAGAGAPDGRRVSGTGARRGADHRDAAAGGDAVPPDAGSRPASAHRGDRTARRPPAAAWRGGIPPLRHLRLPARPDAGRAARAGARGGPRRLRGGDGGAACPCPRRLGRLRRGRHRARLVRAEGEGRRLGVPRLFDRDGGGGDRRAGGERHTGHRRGRRRGGRGGAEPDAVLRRERRPGRRYRHDHRCRWPAHRGDRYAAEAGRSVRASRPRRGR